MITIYNATERLKKGGVINLTPLYDYEQITFHVFKIFRIKMRRRMWRITKPITVQLTNGRVITIPEGFKTDLSSVPRIFWNIAPPFGKFLLADIIHDYLYVERIISQEFADGQMLLWRRAINKNWVDNLTRFLVVRLCGKAWWDS